MSCQFSRGALCFCSFSLSWTIGNGGRAELGGMRRKWTQIFSVDSHDKPIPVYSYFFTWWLSRSLDLFRWEYRRCNHSARNLRPHPVECVCCITKARASSHGKNATKTKAEWEGKLLVLESFFLKKKEKKQQTHTQKGAKPCPKHEGLLHSPHTHI